MITLINEYLKNPVISGLVITSIVLVACIILSKVVRKVLDRYFDKAVEVLKGDPTNYNFFKNGVTFVIFLIGTIVVFRSIPGLRSIGNTLVASAGILAAIVGFASQQAFANIVGGVFIVIFKPFRVGDVIKVGTENPGTVEDITLRHTIINSLENRRIVIPNSIISSATILNSTITDEKVCIFFEIGVSYSANLDKVIAILQKEAMQHPLFIDNRTPEDKEAGTPAVVVRTIAWNESAITLRASIWTNSSLDGFILKCDMFKSVKEAFESNGVEIPYPYRNVIIKQGNMLEPEVS
ncbi:MAG TPA: mechanosensitive ion channel protein MscS [Microscillaceae bacterium]|nr:mechanosensitive ion channel protein MscS [Microscillaceae bacterium]